MGDFRFRAVCVALLLLGACASTTPPPASGSAKIDAAAGKKPLLAGLDPDADLNPFPSTYQPAPSRPTAVVGATVLTATGQQIDNGVVVMSGGRILAVGPAGTPTPAGAVILDGRGKWVTPGIIDIHSHMGDYPVPAVPSRSDGNELTDPNTAQVWAEHSVWPQTRPSTAPAQAG